MDVVLLVSSVLMNPLLAVIRPDEKVPVVERFSFPKEIAPLLSVMEPLPSNKVPINRVVPTIRPAFIVPVVVRSSAPNEILLLLLVIELDVRERPPSILIV